MNGARCLCEVELAAPGSQCRIDRHPVFMQHPQDERRGRASASSSGSDSSMVWRGLLLSCMGFASRVSPPVLLFRARGLCFGARRDSGQGAVPARRALFRSASVAPIWEVVPWTTYACLLRLSMVWV